VQQKVGAVALDPNLRFYVFEYEPDFVKTAIELAPSPQSGNKRRGQLLNCELRC